MIMGKPRWRSSMRFFRVARRWAWDATRASGDTSLSGIGFQPVTQIFLHETTDLLITVFFIDAYAADLNNPKLASELFCFERVCERLYQRQQVSRRYVLWDAKHGDTRITKNTSGLAKSRSKVTRQRPSARQCSISSRSKLRSKRCADTVTTS